MCYDDNYIYATEVLGVVTIIGGAKYEYVKIFKDSGLGRFLNAV